MKLWNRKGLALMEIGKYNEAVECFHRAIKLNPTYTEALKNYHKAFSNLSQEQRYEQEKEGKQLLTDQINHRVRYCPAFRLS